MIKTAVITGATSGIGLETAIGLLEKGYFVIATGRNESKCKETESLLKKTFSDKIKFFTADNSDLFQIKQLAQNILLFLNGNGFECLDVLVNNAGCYMSKQVITKDGLETILTVNYISAFLLTMLLMPLMQKSKDARVISVGSLSHYSASLSKRIFKKSIFYFGFFAYRKSKLALTMMTHELNKRFGSQSYKAYTADPGLVNTFIGEKNAKSLDAKYWSYRKKFGVSPQDSAKNTVFLASENVKTDKYSYYYLCKEKKPSAFSLKEDKCKQLFDLTTGILKKYKDK